ncbi:MAG: 2-iminobutanoate/2-iminopropanoate deaminase [Chloroflexota bacterium]|jgi:enamine deaminase RidA (YjgF/YER057c/UK114 family)|nr:2-iminobutanoate/2-iminopropanoate deaminase [Chloroflexota bacterium]
MAKRTSILDPQSRHPAPIPNGAKIGNLVYSSAIAGGTPGAHGMPEDPQEQANQLFANVRRFLELAGGTPDDVIHMNVMLRDDKYREFINKPWLEMYPDENNRPARHALKVDLRGSSYFQIELVAVLG